jgi:hypothetical protein
VEDNEGRRTAKGDERRAVKGGGGQRAAAIEKDEILLGYIDA